MKITYDEAKRLRNITKHGLDFADLDLSFFEAALVVEANRKRARAIAPFQGRLITVVFVPLGTEALSVISMRPASKKERTHYAEAP